MHRQESRFKRGTMVIASEGHWPPQSCSSEAATSVRHKCTAFRNYTRGERTLLPRFLFGRWRNVSLLLRKDIKPCIISFKKGEKKRKENPKVQKYVFSGILGAGCGLLENSATFGLDIKTVCTCALCLQALPSSQPFVVVILAQTIKRALIPMTWLSRYQSPFVTCSRKLS